MVLPKDTAVLDIVTQAIQDHEQQKQDAKANGAQKKLEQEILTQLALLGGKTFSDDNVVFQGEKFVIPEKTTLPQAVSFLQKKMAEEERVTEYQYTFDYRPWDGAYSMWNVLKRTFGAVAHKDSMVQTFFGKMEAPPQMISIAVGVGKTEQIPWGRFELPFLPNVLFETSQRNHPEKGPLFHISVEGPKKHRFEIQGIFRLIEEELNMNSMYRGKAFDGQDKPEFIDVHSVDRSKVVYSEEVMTQLEANVWAQLRHTNEFERLGIPLKRAVLIHGPFGTGKTLACLLTGQEAIQNGWTFIKARPGRDNISTVLQTARLYSPAVVFYEDIDTVAGSEDSDGIGRLLDDFDGIEAKGTKILCVLTTNYPERIHKGMARPGRLDAMIEINELDQQGVEKLVKTRLTANLSPNVDWTEVFLSAKDYKPAFVTEGADRAIRYIIAREGSAEGVQIQTQDLVDAMHGLRPQYDTMTGAKDTADRDPMATVLENSMRKVVQEHRVNYDEEGAPLTPIEK